MRLFRPICWWLGHSFYEPQPLYPEISGGHLWGSNCFICGFEDWFWWDFDEDD